MNGTQSAMVAVENTSVGDESGGVYATIDKKSEHDLM